MQYRRIFKRKILPAYRILDHFWHIFRESGLTLADIAKSRIDQVCRQRSFHNVIFNVNLILSKPVWLKFGR